MVLLPRTQGGSEAESSHLVFSGSSDVVKFFFVFEQARMPGRSDEDKASQLICHLEGEAFDVYYDLFTKDGNLVEDAKEYSVVKAALIEHFKPQVQPDDIIRQAMGAELKNEDLLGSLREMDRLYEKANFNEEAKFGLLRSAVMEHLDLAQFAIYRGSTSYGDLKNSIKDFWNGRMAFHSSAVYAGVGEGARKPLTSSWSQNLGMVPAKKVMLRPDERVANVENKVDALADQLSQLSLIIKKQATQSLVEGASSSKTCSFCKRPGHGANRCDLNPPRDTICSRCRKQGHSESTCWAKNKPDATRKAGSGDRRNEDAADQDRNHGPPSPEGPSQGHGQVTVVTEPDPTEEDVVATTKRTISGQALPKQARTGGMPVPSLLNPDPMMLEPVLTPLKNVGKSVPMKKKTKTRRSKRISKKT